MHICSFYISSSNPTGSAGASGERGIQGDKGDRGDPGTGVGATGKLHTSYLLQSHQYNDTINTSKNNLQSLMLSFKDNMI